MTPSSHTNPQTEEIEIMKTGTADRAFFLLHRRCVAVRLEVSVLQKKRPICCACFNFDHALQHTLPQMQHTLQHTLQHTQKKRPICCACFTKSKKAQQIGRFFCVCCSVCCSVCYSVCCSVCCSVCRICCSVCCSA